MHRYYYRNRLKSETAKRYYDLLLERFCQLDLSGTYVLPDDGKKENLEDALSVLQAIEYDWPELFFIGKKMKATQYSHKGELHVEVDILYDTETARRIQAVLEKKVKEVCGGLNGLSQWERECQIYTRLMSMLIYDKSEKLHKHNIVSPLLTGHGVCEGFSKLLALMLRRGGVPAIVVRAEDAEHMWNVVWIDGKPYHVDITWDSVGSMGELWYKYFNVTNAFIRRKGSHQSSEAPLCIYEDAEYHHHKHSFFPNAQRLKPALLHTLRTGNGPYVIKLGEGNIDEVLKSILKEAAPGKSYHYSYEEELNMACIWATPSSAQTKK